MSKLRYLEESNILENEKELIEMLKDIKGILQDIKCNQEQLLALKRTASTTVASATPSKRCYTVQELGAAPTNTTHEWWRTF